jgi:hypothetical protein
MFTGFEIDKIQNEFTYLDEKKGKELYKDLGEQINDQLFDLVTSDGVIDGSKLQDNWFPEVNVNIFISHSHIDKDDAIKLAGWLYRNFEIKSFIDSCLWGYSEKLLSNINNKYSDAEPNGSGGTTYNYGKCNYAASHVYMMLTNALMKMIDRAECLLFLHTSNSIRLSGSLSEEKVSSPWIYMELGISKYIRVKPLNNHRMGRIEKKATFSALNEQAALEVHYNPDLDHLIKLNENDMQLWKRECNNKAPYEALDYLYDNYLPKL